MLESLLFSNVVYLSIPVRYSGMESWIVWSSSQWTKP